MLMTMVTAMTIGPQFSTGRGLYLLSGIDAQKRSVPVVRLSSILAGRLLQVLTAASGTLTPLRRSAPHVRKQCYIRRAGRAGACPSMTIAEVPTPSGKVTGIEVDASLAARGKENLSSYSNVHIVEGDGTSVPFDPADGIYVNAGVTRPADQWLDGLREGGRLILPMTARMADDPTNATSGAVFQIERRTSQFSVQCIAPVRIIPCDGARDETSEAALSEAFNKGDCKRVTRLYLE
jgi:hypothetical protein